MGWLKQMFGGKHAKLEKVAWPEDLPPLDEFAQSILASDAVPASLAVVDETKRGSDDPDGTWIGTVFLGKEGETWPTMDGRPMVGLYQLKVSDAPYVPDELSDVVLATMFAAPSSDGEEPFNPLPEGGRKNAVLVRTYTATDKLAVYADRPEPPDSLNPCPATLQEFEDHPPNLPTLEKMRAEGKYDERVFQRIEEHLAEIDGDARWGTKTGGYPAPVQGAIERPVTIQLGGEDAVGINWIDGGCVYLWRQPDGSWEIYMEFH